MHQKSFNKIYGTVVSLTLYVLFSSVQGYWSGCSL